MLIDFSDCKNATAIKAKLRKDTLSYVKEILIEKLGEENVSQTENNEISIAVGEATDENGFNTEVCCNLKFIAKPFKSNPDAKRPVTAFDRYEAAEIFELEHKNDEEVSDVEE